MPLQNKILSTHGDFFTSLSHAHRTRANMEKLGLQKKQSKRGEGKCQGDVIFYYVKYKKTFKHYLEEKSLEKWGCT